MCHKCMIWSLCGNRVGPMVSICNMPITVSLLLVTLFPCNAICPPKTFKYPSYFQDQLKLYLDCFTLSKHHLSLNSYSKYGWDHKDPCLSLWDTLYLQVTDTSQTSLNKRKELEKQKGIFCNPRAYSVCRPYEGVKPRSEHLEEPTKGAFLILPSLILFLPLFLYLYSFLTGSFSV